MLSKIIRLGLTAAIFGLSIYEFVDGEIGNGIALIFPAVLVVFTYFRNERILLSLYHMRKVIPQKLKKYYLV